MNYRNYSKNLFPDKTFKLWGSGNKTATIKAPTAHEAARLFAGKDVFYCGGHAIGSNRAHYTTDRGFNIQVWKVIEEN